MGHEQNHFCNIQTWTHISISIFPLLPRLPSPLAREVTQKDQVEEYFLQTTVLSFMHKLLFPSQPWHEGVQTEGRIYLFKNEAIFQNIF